MKEWERIYTRWSMSNQGLFKDHEQQQQFKNQIKAVSLFWEMQKFRDNKTGYINDEVIQDLYRLLYTAEIGTSREELDMHIRHEVV